MYNFIGILKHLKIADTTDPIKPKPKVLSAIAISVSNNFESLDETNDMFV